MQGVVRTVLDSLAHTLAVPEEGDKLAEAVVVRIDVEQEHSAVPHRRTRVRMDSP